MRDKAHKCLFSASDSLYANVRQRKLGRVPELRTCCMADSASGESRSPFMISHASMSTTAQHKHTAGVSS